MEKKNYDFYISPIAKESLESIIRYISITLKNVKAADELLDLIYSKIIDITLFPFSYPVYENKFLNSKEIRKTHVKKIMIFYSIDEENKRIIVHGIIHSNINK